MPAVLKSIRLYSGLILFAYVATHLVNHALGLVDLKTLEAGRLRFLAVWRNPVGTALLYGAIFTHMALALWSLYVRRSLRMPPWEAVQYVIGFLLPTLLAQHVLATRGLLPAGVDDRYAYVILSIWHFVPAYGIVQAVTLTLAWLHGCIGLHFWLRLKPGYAPYAPVLLAAAVLVPVLALLGFVAAGREVSALAQNREWLREAFAAIHWPNDAAQQFVGEWTLRIRMGSLGAVILVLVARRVRTLLARRRGVVRLTYPDGRTVDVHRGLSVLEASRIAGIPHASVCGGRGRCSTCRVRIGDGLADLPPPSADEEKVLQRVAAPPNVRLACQLRPTAPVQVTPLLPPGAEPHDGHTRPAYTQGRETEIAVLFADLRSFTRFSEKKLPYDVVFVLNRYFQAMGMAVIGAGGHLDKFIGDGTMALFGLGEGVGPGAREALAAARAMSIRLHELNRSLAHDLDEPLRMGIGIHAGPAIVGEMGYGRAITLTAIGDTVNTASRLETLTKELGAELVVSDAVAALAGIDLSAFPARDVTLRGREGALTVRVVADASALPDVAPIRAGRRGGRPAVEAAAERDASA
jgi:adenylate cyclase